VTLEQSTLSVRSYIGTALCSYDEDGLTYNDSFQYNGLPAAANRTTQTLQIKSCIRNTVQKNLTIGTRVAKNQTRVLASKARVRNTVIHAFQGKGRIQVPEQIRLKGRIIPTVSLRARISRRQGGIPPGYEDPGYLLWTDTGLNAKASLYHYIGYPTQTFRSKGRIQPIRKINLGVRARIVGGQGLGIKAHIQPKWSYSHVPISFRVAQVAEKHVTVVFYTEGRVTTPTLTARAYIAKEKCTRMTCHFLVAMPPNISGVMHIDNPTVSARAFSQLSLRAYIAR
jgi:hypothetical protein